MYGLRRSVQQSWRCWATWGRVPHDRNLGEREKDEDQQGISMQGWQKAAQGAVLTDAVTFAPLDAEVGSHFVVKEGVGCAERWKRKRKWEMSARTRLSWAA